MRAKTGTKLIVGLLLAAVLAGGCDVTTKTPTPAPTASPSPPATATTTASVKPTPTASAGSSPEATDAEDESPATDAPGASFTAGPSGAAVATSSVAQVVRLPGEPDPALTPGALNPSVTQANIHSTVCVSGWTATIRPPSSYTNKLKPQQIVQYGYTDTSSSSYEEDHLISLQLGGAPTDPRNLWPEPYSISLQSGQPAGARIKDVFETALKKKVCAGTMTLVEAQREIGMHWVHAYYGIA
ncbi:MAG TPA: hypothetical protein VF375_01765 [Candidatus Limnocylindrales bacterium]